MNRNAWACVDASMHARAVTALRTLAIDAIEQAKSGHPGLPLGAAPMAYTLWSAFMQHSPEHPTWINRDRFVLSAGHGSMLLYGLLHVFGYAEPTMEDIKRFRQWQSKTPGHPEYRHTVGVDATTGPLGQGLAMAVGMAMAEAHLAAVYNEPQFPVIDHNTYVLCGDGDLMEGVSSEAASLAGHLRLHKLIVLYDSNDISLDGDLSLAYSENVRMRFQSYGWDVLRVEDGNDVFAIADALHQAKQHDKPTLIEVKTIIGYGAPNKQGKGGHAGPHGSPLGEMEAALTKQAYGWDEPAFTVPDDVREHFAIVRQEGIAQAQQWQRMFDAYTQAHPHKAAMWHAAMDGRSDIDALIGHAHDTARATRASSGHALQTIAKSVPHVIGGSADLESSTNTHMNGAGIFSAASYAGRNVYFGVREFAMAAALNGMALHGLLRVYGGTFLVFVDYMRPAIRLAALMKLPVIYVLTHDSIAVGEDGPTHEPIEQLASLRCMIGVTVLRPADARETACAWKYALSQMSSPVALVLSRQALPPLQGSIGAMDGLPRGAYVIGREHRSDIDALIIATGSEVHLALEAQKQLRAEDVSVRVVSMPSVELFVQQPDQYRNDVLPVGVKRRLVVEMGSPFGWHVFAGDEGEVYGISTYGASAPGSVVMEQYGFTAAHIAARVRALCQHKQ